MLFNEYEQGGRSGAQVYTEKQDDGLLASSCRWRSVTAAAHRVPDVPDSAVAGEDVFAQLDGSTFYFCWAGAWSTELVVSPDGSFTGYYHDTDMGDSGADYLNGTRYECDFSGTLPLDRAMS